MPALAAAIALISAALLIWNNQIPSPTGAASSVYNDDSAIGIENAITPGDQGNALPVIPGGSGGGGSISCSDPWACKSWGSCSDGTQKRSCSCDCRDESDCTGDHDTSRSCECNDDGDCAKKECKIASCEDYLCKYSDADDSSSCDDKDSCTSEDYCKDGECIPGDFTCECRADSDCPDKSCQSKSCESNNCVYTNEEGSCNDGNSCTANDRCEAGDCIGDNACECTKDNDCDDGDENTQDDCIDNVCLHTALRHDEPIAADERSPKINITAPESVPIISMDLDVYERPRSGFYEPGMEIKRVTASVSGDENISVTGNMSGRKAIPLNFTLREEGVFSADLGDVSYVISNKEGDIRIDVSAIGSIASASQTKYLLIKGSDKSMEIEVETPSDKQGAAPGQPVEFRAKVIKNVEGIAVNRVELIDEGSGESTSMPGKSGTYLSSIQMQRSMGESESFLFAASGSLDGNDTFSAERVTLKRVPELYLYFEKSAQNVSGGKFALIARYVDEHGSLISDNNLSARITSYPNGAEQRILLARSGDYFISEFKKSEGDNAAKIKVVDSFGNVGEQDMPPEFFEQVGEFNLPWDLIVGSIAAAVAVIGGIAAIMFVLRKKKAKRTAEKSLEGQEQELVDLIKKTKLQFFKRQISDEAANKQINEYETKLAKVKALRNKGKEHASNSASDDKAPADNINSRPN